MNVNREMLAFLRKQYPVGTRIRLDSMQDPYAPVEAGTTGKLDYIDDAGQFPYEAGQRTDAGAHPRRGQLYCFAARAQHDEAIYAAYRRAL